MEIFYLLDGCGLDGCGLYGCSTDGCGLDGCGTDGCGLDGCGIRYSTRCTLLLGLTSACLPRV